MAATKEFIFETGHELASANELFSEHAGNTDWSEAVFDLGLNGDLSLEDLDSLRKACKVINELLYPIYY